jgi:hypothetical protein
MHATTSDATTGGTTLRMKCNGIVEEELTEKT